MYTNLSNFNEFIQNLTKIQSTESNKWIDTIANPKCIIQYPVEIIFQKNVQAAFQVIYENFVYDIT